MIHGLNCTLELKKLIHLLLQYVYVSILQMELLLHFGKFCLQKYSNDAFTSYFKNIAYSYWSDNYTNYVEIHNNYTISSHSYDIIFSMSNKSKDSCAIWFRFDGKSVAKILVDNFYS